MVSMDDFRTSKLCSQCHQTLSSVHYFVNTKLTKRKKRKGVVLIRNRAEVHGARYWDRDVNAAMNMLELIRIGYWVRDAWNPSKESREKKNVETTSRLDLDITCGHVDTDKLQL
ncbi:hypothetical protein JG687_00004419 [Phytophthora cactorum]|uniref:Transposase n=1 Tax=Phytophthora cactorum TaxID=29920 RepID=A0A8T1UNQ9_9STRA|nr:hypothetical protein JG687_00004419 [Phytophthora cactorum]